MSAGYPFRQPMHKNCKSSPPPLLLSCPPGYLTTAANLSICRTGPFVGTIIAALVLITYMVLEPAHWLRKLMQLTKMSYSFKTTLIGLGIIYFVLAWVSENYIFPRLSRALGKARLALSNKPKQRKEYKVIAERMQM